jgi:hypothetical protein
VLPIVSAVLGAPPTIVLVLAACEGLLLAMWGLSVRSTVLADPDDPSAARRRTQSTWFPKLGGALAGVSVLTLAVAALT